MLIFTLFSAFVSGLLTSTHCMGMCGGFMASLSMSNNKVRSGNNVAFLLSYNAGRIISYMVAGIIMGAVGYGGMAIINKTSVQKILYLSANLILIALGLYLANIWRGITVLEKIGGTIWPHITPMIKKITPVRSVPHAIAFGVLWGWIPCGLVYSMLIVAFAWANPLYGALIMLSFGLGTLPSLMVIGLFANQIRPWLQKSSVRLATGLIVMLFGVVGLLKLTGIGHQLYALCVG